MKIMQCPLNGPRNISEFQCGGEVKMAPDAETCTDAEWAHYLFLEDNVAGEVDEWWCHLPTSYWFIATRDTRTEDIIKTYSVSDYFKRTSQSEGV